MGRRPGPLDHGQRITTLELLDTVDRCGPQWPAALAGYTIEAVSTAVGREIMSGNLRDGAHLSEQGRAALARLRGAGEFETGRLVVRRQHDCAEHPSGCWRIDCTDCGAVAAEHIADVGLERAVTEAVTSHCCA